MAVWDAIVLGAGGVGSATAMHLSKSGARTLAVDQYPPAHANGSSHGQTRIIRQAYFEHPCYVPLLQRAYDLWHQLEASTSQKLFHRTGLVELGPRDGIVIPGVLQSAKEYSLPIEELSPSTIHERWPGLRGDEKWGGVIEQNAGFLRVEQCVQAHLDTAKRHGCQFLHDCTVLDWTSDQNEVKVFTDRGVETAARLVIAAGSWTRSLFPILSPHLRILRKYLYWFKPEKESFREQNGFPCFFHETPQGFFYGFPCFNGTGVKLARHSGGQLIESPDSSSTKRKPQDDQDRRLVIEYANQYLPGLGSNMTSTAKCYYTSTPDEHFVIDRAPGHPNVTVVAGMSGHGFKFASALGELASQMALNTEIPFDLTPFTIRRFAS